MALYKGPIVDVDVHHAPTNDAELVEYLPRRWREYGEACLKHGIKLRPPRAASGPLVHSGGMRADVWEREGIEQQVDPGSGYELMCEVLLDSCDIRRCLLLYNLGQYSFQTNPQFGAALCQAANDWNVDRWLSRDDRFYSGVLVSPGDPQHAAREIRRLADHPRMSAVLLLGDPLNRALGEPLYEPIFEAAAETGLAIVTHPTLEITLGIPGTTNEHLSQVNFRGMVDAASLVVHGVFERHPSLRVLMAEFGVTWLPSLLWGLDASIDQLRVESPWVKRLPSEYIREHIKFGIQPMESVGAADARNLIKLLTTVEHVEDMLCFSSDYPHWSMDEFEFVSHHMPDEWHRKLFLANAAESLGWSATEIEAERVPVGARG